MIFFCTAVFCRYLQVLLNWIVGARVLDTKYRKLIQSTWQPSVLMSGLFKIHHLYIEYQRVRTACTASHFQYNLAKIFYRISRFPSGSSVCTQICQKVIECVHTDFCIIKFQYYYNCSDAGTFLPVPFPKRFHQCMLYLSKL